VEPPSDPPPVAGPASTSPPQPASGSQPAASQPAASQPAAGPGFQPAPGFQPGYPQPGYQPGPAYQQAGYPPPQPGYPAAAGGSAAAGGPVVGAPRQPPWRRPTVLALIAGLVLGGGIVGSVWLASGGGAVDSDGAAACNVLSRMGELTKEFSSADIQRLGAVYGLGEAAAAGDPKYKELAAALKSSYQHLEQFDIAGANADLIQARKLCDGL